MTLDFTDMVIYALGIINGGRLIYNIGKSYTAISDISKLSKIDQKQLKILNNQYIKKTDKQQTRVILQNVRYYPSSNNHIQKLIPQIFQYSRNLIKVDSSEKGLIQLPNFKSKIQIQFTSTDLKLDDLVLKTDISRNTYFQIKNFITLTVVGKIGYDFSNNQNLIVAEVLGKNIQQIIEDYWSEIKYSGLGLAFVILLVKFAFSVKNSLHQEVRRQRDNWR